MSVARRVALVALAVVATVAAWAILAAAVVAAGWAIVTVVPSMDAASAVGWAVLLGVVGLLYATRW